LLKQSPTAKPGDKDQRYLDTIIESVHFAGTLVDKLLGYSQVGRARLAIRDIDLNSILAELVSDLRREYSGRRITVRVPEFPRPSPTR
jgi:light-regulated signal transduction histidine kinase (bacteriophytochrome)